MEMNRRSFLKAGAVAAGTAAASANVAFAEPAQGPGGEGGPQPSAEGAEEELDLNWREPMPAVDESLIVDTTSAEIVVIGAGHAGTAVARRAAEGGKDVILVEAQAEDAYFIIGNDIGHINSEYLKAAGVAEVDPIVFYNDWMIRAQNGAHPDLIMQFAQNSGRAVDWFLQDVDQEYLDTMTISYWPRDERMLDEIASQKFWTGTVQWGMGNEHSMTEVYRGIFARLREDLPNLSIEFDRTGQYLEKDETGRVTGVVTLDSDGAYHRYEGTQAVVLAAGDFGANKAMMTDLCVTANDVFQDGLTGWKNPFGAKDGSGIKMGVWAGGRLEPRPLASMNGDFVIPSMITPVGIYLNYKGERFCNEYFGDPTLSGKPAARIKQTVYYSIFDSKLPDTGAYSVSGHTCTDPQPATLQGFADKIAEAYAAGPDGVNGTYAADDLETLADYMGLDEEAKANMIAAVARYNANAANGRDEDYGKDPRVLFPIDEPPYMGVVAGPDHVGGVMVTLGGLMTDKHCNVYDEHLDEIPGLYAAGNCLGQRFGIAYFSPIPGVSIGSALTLGYLLGEHLAEL